MAWDALIERARKSFEDPDFDSRERNYKREIARAFKQVLELARDDGDWSSELRSAFGRKYLGAEYNLSYWREHQWLIDADTKTRASLQPALAGFLETSRPAADRFQAFAEVAERFAGKPGSNPGSILAVGSVFNFAVDPERLPPIKTRVFTKAEDEAGFSRPEGEVAALYEGHLDFVPLARKRFEEAGVPIRDMLDVQSVLWEFSHPPETRGRALRDALEKILSDYEKARVNEPFGHERQIWGTFEVARDELAALDEVQALDSLDVVPSIGVGNWARVPWIALLDRRETNSTRHGVYPVYLFRQDSTGVYLTLAQGVSDLIEELGRVRAHETLEERARALRHYCRDLEKRGFSLDEKIDLRSDPGLGRDYEASVAAHKFYERNRVPDDSELEADLAALLTAYTTYLDRKVTPPLERLAKELSVPGEWLGTIRALLEEQRQVIFKGPPGTGKTYVAHKLAQHLAGDPSRVRLVQFHASYAYEDFVQGYRPVIVDGTAGFKLVDGPLIELARIAAADPEHTYVLIIDELNRGNVAKVFGELYFLLEYRDEGVRLQYGAGDFELPPNLWFIGTMNTADQSIALFDSALRRRFRFVDFYPTEPPIDQLLRTWLDNHGYGGQFDWLADVLDEANRKLADREIAIGPSYFLDPERELSEERIAGLWRHAVMPYLEEQFFGEEERRREFSLEALRRSLESTPEAEALERGDESTAA